MTGSSAGSTSAGASSARCCRQRPSTPRSSGRDGKTYLFSGDRYVRYSGADYSYVEPGFPRLIARDWGGMDRVDAAFVLDDVTYLFGTAGLLFRVAVPDESDWPAYEADLDAGEVPAEVRERLLGQGLQLAADARVEGRSPQWTVPLDQGRSVEVRREPGRLTVRNAADGNGQFWVRYSGRSYTEPDAGYPRPLTDDWWNLPDPPADVEGHLSSIDAVFTGKDDRTYLFAGDRFVVFDNRHRWWSQPSRLCQDWDSLPFDRVDAAFLGADGKTYVFGAGKYVRYSGDDYSRVDDRYPKPVTAYWGNVVNNITRSGASTPRWSCARPRRGTARTPRTAPRRRTPTCSPASSTSGTPAPAYATVDDGYPREHRHVARAEPRFANLTVLSTAVSTPPSPTGATSTCSPARAATSCPAPSTAATTTWA